MRNADAGSGGAAPALVRLLGLAGTPVFAAMALLTYLAGGQPDMLCMSMQHSSPLGGMGVMYALMAVAHAGPWLKMVQGR